MASPAKRGRPLAASRTVTFAALKPGLVLGDGATMAGTVEVADIGLDTSGASAHLVEPMDVGSWLRSRARDAHKWSAGVRMVAGSAGMTGAAHLASASAQRAGSGMVTLSSPGIDAHPPVEVVQHQVPGTGWAKIVLDGLDRFHALVVGPGLGREEATVAAVRELVAAAELPVLVDGDGLYALSWSDAGAAPVLRGRRDATVLTPHDGEYGLLTGQRPGADRIAACRRLAADVGGVVLLKGPTTVVADAAGGVLVTMTGDARLATAGTGDVLSGIIGALLAIGLPALQAAAAGAWIHGRASRLGPPLGLVASDLLAAIPVVLDEVVCECREVAGS